MTEPQRTTAPRVAPAHFTCAPSGSAAAPRAPLTLADAALHRALTAHQLQNAAAALERGLYRGTPASTAALLREAAVLLSEAGL